MIKQISIPYSDPVISPAKPGSSDMSKDWYVWFRFFDADEPDPKKRWKQLRYKGGINQFKIYRERIAEANALKQALKEKLKEGWNPLKKPVKEIQINSLVEAIDHLLALKNKTLKKKSQQTYKHVLGLLKTWLEEHGIKSIHIKMFTADLAQQYMDDLLLKREYSGRTFNDHLIILSTFFNIMVKRKWCFENPFHSIMRMKTTIGRNHAYTEQEKEDLRKLLYKEDRWMYYFSQFIYHCFIRRTELVRIKIRHIDVQNKTIIIPGDDAKNNMQESVVIPVGLEKIIKEIGIHNYPPDFYLFGRHLYPSEVPYMHVDHISGRHNKFPKKLKIDKNKGLYSWKHTGVCDYYYATNKDIYALMRQLRHKSLETTQIYLKSLGLIDNNPFRNALVA